MNIRKATAGLLAALALCLALVFSLSGCQRRTLTGGETITLPAPSAVEAEETSSVEESASVSVESAAESETSAEPSAAETFAMLDRFSAYATDIFVYDCVTGGFTELTCDGDSRIYPASTTKLLTALLALELMEEDEVIQPGDEVYMTGENASFAYVRPQHRLTVSTLIEGMLLPSGNDAAYALAAACGRRLAGDESLGCEAAVARFVDGMNEYARKIGCTGSHFTAPDGFDGESNYSCLYDMAIISRLAAENEVIMRYAGLHSDDVTYASGHTITWVNTNKQLDPESEYYDSHVTGLKTGSLNENCCVITSYDDGEHRFILGVFGAKTDDERYADTKALIALLTRDPS